MSVSEPPQLPRLAETAIRLLAGPGFSDAVLGDLQEELAHRLPANRSGWVWKEILTSAPGLFGMRLRNADFEGRLPVAALTLAMFVLLYLWTVFVTIPIMIGLHDSFGIGGTTGYIYFYLLVRLPSVLFAGMVIAYLTFQRDRSLIRNAATRLSPLLLLIALPQLSSLVGSGNMDQWVSQIARILADTIALLAAARLALWLRRKWA
jgi:hypothetical protein